MKYNKHLSKSSTTIIYIIILIGVIVLNIVLARLSLNNKDNELTFIVVSCLLEIGGLAYFIIQDIISTRKSIKFSKQIDSETSAKNDIPFIDRTDLIKEVVNQSLIKLENNEYYYEMNIKYDEQNGKYSFANRLVNEFVWLRDRTGKPITEITTLQSKKLGCVYFVDYSKHHDNFEEYVKGLYYIKHKKNIIIVNNYYNKQDYWSDNLKDRDIFFVKLNYLLDAEDKLLFPDDKIVELLKTLSDMPKYETILKNKDFKAISKKLGQLSNNNIGNLISILDSKDFVILLETDEAFIKFYFELRAANYQKAEEKYNTIILPTNKSKVYDYKLKYEHANLTHFLGQYELAYAELERLDSELLVELSLNDNVLLSQIRFDVVLLQSHIKKHMGSFNDAKALLENVTKDNSLIWLRSNFAVDVLILNELENNSSEWKNKLNTCLDNMNKFDFLRNKSVQDSDYYFYEAYYPIVAFYNRNFDLHCINELIKIEDVAIEFYNKNEQRFMTNCLFIKAELLRISGNLSSAIEYYARCYQVYLRNGDKDILYLVAITEKYIATIYGRPLGIIRNLDEVLNNCLKETGYAFHNRLLSRLQEASANKCLDKLKKHFEETINPIP